MIELKIEDYCQDCPEFKAEINESVVIDRSIKQTQIRCKHEDRCLSIKTYLETVVGKEQNND